MDTSLSQILEFMQQLSVMNNAKFEKILAQRPKDPYESEQTNELVAALAKAHGEYSSIGNNRDNPYFKSQYADYDKIMSIIRPILSKHGLVLVQKTVIDDVNATRTLHTQLKHSSGQWTESRERIIPEKNDDQKWASSVTFKKRHQAMAILNITIDRDKYDDDAELNVQESRLNDLKGTAIDYSYSPQEQQYETVNVYERDQLTQALQGWPDMCKEILKNYKIASLADLPKDKYEHVKNQVLLRIKARTSGTTPVAK